MKRIIIIGATSGIGLEVARIYIRQGWQVGIAGRRKELLAELKATAPDQIKTEQIDVTNEEAPSRLLALIEQLGGMDVFLLSSGIGFQNRKLDMETELATMHTNGIGFTQMITTSYHYFRQHGGGHIAIISSIAGTKGLGAAPSYSATKRYQNTYIDALSQLSHMDKSGITFTDIRPGFVQTALLKDDKYPFLMSPEKVARRIVQAINRKKRRATIDWRYRILVFFWRLLPQWLWERLSFIHSV